MPALALLTGSSHINVQDLRKYGTSGVEIGSSPTLELRAPVKHRRGIAATLGPGGNK